MHNWCGLQRLFKNGSKKNETYINFHLGYILGLFLRS